MPYLSGPVLSVSKPYVSYPWSAVAHLKLALDNCCWSFSSLNFLDWLQGSEVGFLFFSVGISRKQLLTEAEHLIFQLAFIRAA